MRSVSTLNVTARNLTVQWQRPFDGYNTLTHYSIHLLKNCDETDELGITVDVTEHRRIVLGNLVPFTWYCIDIQAFNALGGSERTMPVRLKTRAAGFLTGVGFQFF